MHSVGAVFTLPKSTVMIFIQKKEKETLSRTGKLDLCDVTAIVISLINTHVSDGSSLISFIYFVKQQQLTYKFDEQV